MQSTNKTCTNAQLCPNISYDMNILRLATCSQHTTTKLLLFCWVFVRGRPCQRSHVSAPNINKLCATERDYPVGGDAVSREPSDCDGTKFCHRPLRRNRIQSGVPQDTRHCTHSVQRNCLRSSQPPRRSIDFPNPQMLICHRILAGFGLRPKLAIIELNYACISRQLA